MNEKEHKPVVRKEIEKLNDLFQPNQVESVLPVISEKMRNSKSLDEAKEYWDFLDKIRNSNINFENQKANNEEDLKKKKLDFKFYKIQKTVNMSIGILLFFISFFVFYYYDQTVGSFLFGSSLAALGINTINLKSLINK